ncbi:MAG: FAD:protein FMN transferase [Spirochaetota bacterium]|nr:FAD:protein FMN transferase [Spirochaetota bacterium]
MNYMFSLNFMEKRSKHISTSLILILSLIPSLYSCKKKSLFTFNKALIGTIINLTIIADSKKDAQNSAEQVFNEIERIENIMSPYREESDIYKINKSAWKTPVTISDETFSLIQESINISLLTNGSFDVTFASLSRLWNFSKDPFIPPTISKIRNRLLLVDYKLINLNNYNNSIRIEKRGTKIELGGIAKGYSIRKGIECFINLGIKNAILEAGGDLQVIGNKFGRQWQVGLRNPREQSIILAIKLSNLNSIASSGDYEKFKFYKNKRYHHIINPKSGFPSKTFSSVSVISKDAVKSDAFATAFFVMGKEKTIEFLKKNDDLLAILIDLDMKVLASKGLKEMIIPLKDVEIEWF